MKTGGSETMLIDILNRQCEKATTGLLIVNDKVNEQLIQTIDSKVNIFFSGRKESSKIQLFRVYRKIRKIVNDFQPDVIHCHDNKLYPFFFSWRQKTCLTVHGMNLSTLFVKRFGMLFSISEAVRKDVMQRTGKDSIIVYNGIVISHYQTRNEYAYNPNKEEFNIVQIGLLDFNIKGQQIAVEALKMILEKHPEVMMKLYFIGEGKDLQRLKSLVSTCNLNRNVVFYGLKHRTWIKNELKNFNILIQPSLNEGFGLTLIEGFAAGLPVIASNIGGPKEILGLLNAGLQVEAGNAEDLANKIYMVYESYISNIKSDTIENCNVKGALKDKNRLKIFDVASTSEKYLKNYEILLK
jgi:glycosyltransferase involved in cell wall biosynthesis